MREMTDDVPKALMSQKYGKGYGDGFSAGYDAGYWNGVRDVLEKHREFLTQVEKISAKKDSLRGGNVRGYTIIPADE